jgi:hypothetical protein
MTWGSLEHLQTINMRLAQERKMTGNATGELLSADEKSLSLQLFFGYFKTRY